MLTSGQRQLIRRFAAADFNGIVVRQVSSTNQLARRIIAEFGEDDTSPPLAVIVGLEQTAGRGRLQRRWVSPPAVGSYISVIERVASPRLETLPIGVAVAVSACVNALLDDRCRIKWPNDLVVAGRKLGGILIEAVPRSDACADVVIGVGLNTTAERDGRPDTATSIGEERRRPVEWSEVTWGLVEALVAFLREPPPADELIERYRQLSSHRPGELLRCQLGDRVLEGSFSGFDGRGFLRLSVDGDEQLIPAGEVIE